VVALITAGAAACGADKATPQSKVSDAFQNLGKQNTVTLGLGFDGSADQLYAAMKGEDDFTRNDAQLLSTLKVSVSVSSKSSFNLLGKDAKGNEGSFAFALSTDGSGSNLVEIRYVDKKAYLRVDIKGLEKLDTSPNAAADTRPIDDFLNGVDQLPSSLDSVKSGIKGNWISIDPTAFEQFAKSLASQSASGGDSALSDAANPPKIDAATQKRLIDGLKKALSTNVTYKDLGSKDGADHIQVTAPAQQLAQAVKTNLDPVLKSVPGMPASGLSGLDDVPAKNISVDVAVKNGSVSAITFDVAQLDTQAHGHVPLTLTLDGSAKAVSTPDGAKVVNPQDIMGLVMSAMGQNQSDSDSF
jgi:hypothetical protein